MQITESAKKAILDVMRAKRLDPGEVFLEISFKDNALGLGFTREQSGKATKYGELVAVIDYAVDTSGIIMDFGNIEGRSGFIFTGE